MARRRRRARSRRTSPPTTTPEAAFAARFHLVHEWRKFLFTDPGLPRELLPDDWAGRRATDYFRREAGRLASAAEAFVARTLTPA